MYRIVFYLDNPAGRCAFLRETAGNYEPPETHPFVVIAREFDESGNCTRTWWLSMGQAYDGLNPLDEHATPHQVVDPNIVAGEESKPANPMTRRGGDLQAVLHTLRQRQIKDILKVRQTETFSRTYTEALNRAAQLQADLSTADSNVRHLAERNATLADELQQVRSELEALRQQRSLRGQAAEWGRRWLAK